MTDRHTSPATQPQNQPPGRPQNQPVLRFAGVLVFCADLAATAAYYRDALGLVLDWSADDHVGFHLPTAGDPRGAWVLLHQQDANAITPHELGTFAVDDVDATVARIEQAGYPVARQPSDAPWGVREAWIQDPNGYGLTITGPLRPES